MTGHGSPTRRPADLLLPGIGDLTRRLILFCLLLLGSGNARADEVAARLRFAWGGGSPRLWHGEVKLESGTLERVRPLGVEADEPGSIWFDQERIHIEQRSTRTYDAVDVWLTADPAARIKITLTDPASAEAPSQTELTLADILAEKHNSVIDEAGNRLVVGRMPGDELRVHIERDHLVYRPGEPFRCTLEPQLAHLAGDSPVWIDLQLIAANDRREVWSDSQELLPASTPQGIAAVPVSLPLPAEEGVYELVITASTRTRRYLVPVTRSTVIAKRRVQLVVLADQPPTRSIEDRNWEMVWEIDPANPGWWKRMVSWPQWKLIPRLNREPLSNGHTRPLDHELGLTTQLTPQDASGPAAWQTYPLLVSDPGRPHILELEFPSNVPQQMGISILEPDAAGRVQPVGLDSGIHVPAAAEGSQARWQTHRLVFWPRTRTPLLLLTSTHSVGGVFGKIRVAAGPDHLPAVRPPEEAGQRRMVAAYWDRPLFAENFSAPGRLDASLAQAVDDWTTFYEGGRRLAEYLHHAGYNAAFVSVLADGSSLYPSEQLQPTPRHDTGLLGNEGLDPLRKDALELLLRIFDREQLSLVPVIQFAAPLPRLEQALRQAPLSESGIRLIGPDGASWLGGRIPQRGLAPYYNPLNEDVQSAMLDVVRELAKRYAGHQSLDGLALQLGGAGYATLPGPEWGLDDRTVDHFSRDTKIDLPAAGPKRFARRAELLLGEHREAWLRWRATEMMELYQRMQAEISVVRPNAKLYLCATELLETGHARERLRPALPTTTLLDDFLLEVGIATELIDASRGVVLLRPRRMEADGALNRSALAMAIDGPAKLDEELSAAGCLFYHPPRRLRLREFDAVSPFGADRSFTLLVSQTSPAGMWNRRRFIRALALADSQTLVDGGWLLPLGQQEALAPLLYVYRQLPAERFERSEASRQPLVIRRRSVGDETYIYIVNNASWQTEATVGLSAAADSRIVALSQDANPLSLQAHADGSQLTVTLAPFGLQAFRVSQGDVRVQTVDFELPAAIEQELAGRIEQLGVRAAALAQQPRFDVLTNPGFDEGAANQQATARQIPGWSLLGEAGESARLELDRQTQHTGSAALKLISSGEVASLQSELFRAPPSGRLALAVWVRVEDPARQPVLRLAVEGPDNGRTYYRFAQVGAGATEGARLTSQFKQFVFPVDDVPLADLAQLRVRFDLMGRGTVWIDDIELHHLRFTKSERVELSKILVSASRALEAGEVADCVRLLDGYWPQFLAHHVPAVELVRPRVARAPARRARKRTQSSRNNSGREEPGMFGRLKQYVPGFLRF